MKNHYGLNSRSVTTLSTIVCDALGYGKYGKGAALLSEVSAVESHLGEYKDPTPNGAGFGLTQFDKIGFDDVVARTRQKHKEIVFSAFGYDINEVKIEYLNNDPLLSLIFCRLKFKLIPDLIPEDIISRASYWKRFYNTVAGKGTPEHYLSCAEKYLYNDN